jgi:hypothetical protein
MGKSLATHLTKQTGEFLVAGELCRRGLFATTFSGNMPYYDAVVHTNEGFIRFIQVKARREATSSWVLSTEEFLELECGADHHAIRGLIAQPVTDLFYVFVVLRATGLDEFYVLNFSELQSIVHQKYAEWLAKKNRPKVNPFDLRSEWIANFRDRWDAISEGVFHASRVRTNPTNHG